MSQILNIEHRIKTMKEKNILDANKKHIIDFIDYKAADGISEARQVWYCSNLSTIAQHIDFDFKKADEKDILQIKRWINNSGLSDWSKHDKMVSLRAIYGYIYPKKKRPDCYEDIKPRKDKLKKKLPRGLLTFDDIKKIAEHTKNPRDRSLIITLFETGARISEIQGLKINDVEFDKYGAKITLPDNTKTGARKIRVIWSAPTINHWLHHHPEKNNKDAYLFCGLQKRSLTKELNYSHINSLIKEAAKKAGIEKKVNPHHFRHSRASMLAKKLTEQMLCQYMGWVIGSSQSKRYVHLSGRDIDRAILEMNDMVEEEEKEQKHKPIECPRCGLTNDPFSKFCNGCSLGLDEKSMMEYDQQKEQAAEIGFLMKNEKTYDALFKQLQEMQKEIQQLKKKK